jgi:hypothetical protein
MRPRLQSRGTGGGTPITVLARVRRVQITANTRPDFVSRFFSVCDAILGNKSGHKNRINIMIFVTIL